MPRKFESMVRTLCVNDRYHKPGVHGPKEFSLRLTWCPWLVGYYGTRGISRGARKLARTPSLSKKKLKKMTDIVTFNHESQASIPLLQRRLSMKNEERKIEREDACC